VSDLRRQLEDLVDDADEAMRTRDRLLAARLIAHEQVSDAGEDLVLAVFRELCAVRGAIDDGYDDGCMETLH
jgi:hypothetical protein